MKDQQDLNKKSALMSYLESELKTSKTLEEFKRKFADVKAIVELLDKKAGDIAVAEKLDWGEYDSILTRNICEKTVQVMNGVEALNDFWLEMMTRFVTREGSGEIGRPLLNNEKVMLHNLLTKNSIFPLDETPDADKTAQRSSENKA